MSITTIDNIVYSGWFSGNSILVVVLPDLGIKAFWSKKIPIFA